MILKSKLTCLVMAVIDVLTWYANFVTISLHFDIKIRRLLFQTGLNILFVMKREKSHFLKLAIFPGAKGSGKPICPDKPVLLNVDPSQGSSACL